MKRMPISSGVNKMISTVGRFHTLKERNELIEDQDDFEDEVQDEFEDEYEEEYEDKDELKPKYSFENFEFDFKTRIARLEFLHRQYYRTVDRYITRNYVRYPIYSDWKTKEKRIKKTIKLTNSELENLLDNDDELIRLFAVEIVSRINKNHALLPSWFVKLYFKAVLDEEIKRLEEDFHAYLQGKNEKIQAKKLLIASDKTDKEALQFELKKAEEEKSIIQQKINWISLKKKSVFLMIITFGIYYYLISEKRKKKLEEKESILKKSIQEINKEISRCEKSIKECEKDIKGAEDGICEYRIHHEDMMEEKFLEYNERVDRVKSLDSTVTHDDFIKLKDFAGLKQEKIIGCYIIHNMENDKYYVGQSKDVMKRIKQHFNGTTPKNIIFAEDYYTSSYSKDDLFEIKIIRCETKDELDKMERDLIQEYDSRNNGYNGTSGNM